MTFEEFLSEVLPSDAAAYVGLAIIVVCVWIIFSATLMIFPFGEKVIQRVFDFFFLVSEKKRTRELEAGVRLEKVLEMSKKAYVWPEFLKWSPFAFGFSIFGPFLLAVTVSFINLALGAFVAAITVSPDVPDFKLIDPSAPEWGMAFWAWPVLAFLTPTLTYHVLRWQQRQDRYLIYTDEMRHRKGGVTIPSLFKAGEDMYISATPTTMIEDVLARTDPDLLDNDIKTSRLRKWWNKRRFQKEDVMSLSFPSRAGPRAHDLALYRENAVAFMNARGKIRRRAAFMLQLRGTAESRANAAGVEALAGGATDAQAEEAFQAVMVHYDALLRIKAEPSTIDEATVEDPDHWSFEGFEIGQELAMPGVTIAEVQEEFSDELPGRPVITRSLDELKQDNAKFRAELEALWDSDTFYKRKRIEDAGLERDDAIAFCLRSGITLRLFARLLGQGWHIADIEARYVQEKYRELQPTVVDRVTDVAQPPEVAQPAKRSSTLREVDDSALASGDTAVSRGRVSLRLRRGKSSGGRTRPSQLREVDENDSSS